MRQKKIDKSGLAISEPKRIRSRKHLKWISEQPCLVCGTRPCQSHHVKFLQLRARGLKVSDDLTVPLCLEHHVQIEAACGHEEEWWTMNIINVRAEIRRLRVMSPALENHDD